MKAPETRITRSPDGLRREVIAEYWRARVPTTDIAMAMGIDEAEVCRVINEIEGDGNVRKDVAG